MNDKPRPADPNATMQIDLSQVQLEDILPPRAEEKPRSLPPSVPPPLPPVVMTTSLGPVAPSKGKTIAMLVVFGVLLVAAIAGGLAVGAHFRNGSSATVATPGAP